MLRTSLTIIAKFLAITFALLTLILIGISFFRPEWIKIAIDWIGALIQTLGYWNYVIAFGSACIESLPIIGTAVPGMNVMILVGGFWAREHFIITILSAISGAMLGNYLGYWIGKWYGHELIEKYGDWFGIGRTEQRILEGQLQKNGFWYVTLGKFHNFTRAFIPFIAGASGMKEQNFWLYNMIGSIIWALSINILGIFFIDHYQTILDNLGKVMTFLLIGVILYMYVYKRDFLRTYMRDKQAEIDARIARDQTLKKG